MAATNWVLDPTHSEVEFKVKHLMISTVTGTFSSFAATVTTDGDTLGDLAGGVSHPFSMIENRMAPA